MSTTPVAVKQKILFVNGGQFGHSAGHYYYCKYLKDSFDIHYFCFDRGRRKMDMPGVKVHYVDFAGGKLRRNFNFVAGAIRLSRQIRPETLYVVYFGFAFIVALLAFAGKAKILDIRTGSLAPNPAKRKLDNIVIRLQSLFFSKKVILAESLRQKLGIALRNTLVLPLGADVIYDGSHDFNGKLHLIYVGTLDGRRIDETVKGLGLFMQNENNKNSIEKYSIIGFGGQHEIDKIMNEIKASSLEHIVFFEGQKSHAELEVYFSDANVGVAYIPMLEYYQNQPATKLFEYGLSGMFTIATNTFENRNFIREENGVLCDDNPLAFSKALSEVVLRKKEFNSGKIRQSLDDYRWELLVQQKLRGFINN